MIKNNGIAKRISSLNLERGLYNAPGHIYWKNTDGIYLGCNHVNAKTLNLARPADIVGKTDFDLAWKKEAHIFRKNDLYVIDTREPETVEEIATLPRGAIIYISQKIPLIDENFKVVGVMGISIDVTIKRHVKNSITENKPVNPIFESLSVQEWNIMRLVISGFNIKDISMKLSISPKTVSSYRYRIFEKLNIKNDIELMHIVLKNNLQYLINQYLR
jgi:DNA-binding CsgD family transcriptional regulator